MIISIIVPCRDKNISISGLLEDLAQQKHDHELEIVRVDNVSPPGKARNTGAHRAKGEYFIFLDCDIRLGSERFIERLLTPLMDNERNGATCASIRAPAEASRFQLIYAQQIPHAESPVVDQATSVQVASSACFAVSRKVFHRVGGFHEKILRGEDSLISDRIRKEGYRLLLVAHTWCFHPQPDNYAQLIRVNLRDGAGCCFVDAFYPKQNLDVHPEGVTHFSGRKTVPQRIARFVRSSWTALKRGQFLLLSAKFFYALGYLWGILRYRILRWK